MSPPRGDPSDWPRAEIRKWIGAAERFTFEDELRLPLKMSFLRKQESRTP